jgi:SecD/SecF fusion protein
MITEVIINLRLKIKKSPSTNGRFFFVFIVFWMGLITLIPSCSKTHHRVELLVEPLNLTSNLNPTLAAQKISSSISRIYGISEENISFTIEGNKLNFTILDDSEKGIQENDITLFLNKTSSGLEFNETHSLHEFGPIFQSLNEAIRKSMSDSLLKQFLQLDNKITTQSDTSENKSNLAQLLANKNTAVKNTQQDSLLMQYPLMNYLFMLSQPNEDMAEIGFVKLSDTARCMELLRLPSCSEILPSSVFFTWGLPNEQNQYIPLYALKKNRGLAAMSGDLIANCTATKDANGNPTVEIQFNSAGAQKFEELTEKLYLTKVKKATNQYLTITYGGQVFCAPLVDSKITGGKANISGSFSVDETKVIAAVIQQPLPFSTRLLLFKRTVHTD